LSKFVVYDKIKGTVKLTICVGPNVHAIYVSSLIL